MPNPAEYLLSLAEHDERISFIFDLNNHRFVYTNAAFTRFFNTTSSDLSWENIYAMIHPDDLGYLQRLYAELRTGVMLNDIEFRLLLGNRQQRIVKAAVLVDNGGGQKVLSGYLEDISGFRAHEDTLRDLSNKKNAILNILSHDLAGPLGSIQNYTYLLAKKSHSLQDEQAQKMLRSVEHISHRCIQMIQDFLKLEILESVGVQLVKTRLDLVEKIGLFMEDYIDSEQDLKKNIEFSSSHPKIYAAVDENKFTQVINNLISNSMKFTPNGGTIHVRIEKKLDKVLISVADNGIGIPEKYHTKLFDKFSDARRTGLKGEESVGLGMSIIKTIVEWHGGQIWFESTQEVGSTFYIEIEGCE